VPTARVIHNKGGSNIVENSESVKNLVYRYNKGSENSQGAIVWRYDPSKVKDQVNVSKKNLQILRGENDHAWNYENNAQSAAVLPKDKSYFSFMDGIGAIADPVGAVADYFKRESVPGQLLDAYKKNYSQLGKSSNLPPAILDEMFQRQVGIAGQESKFGTSSKYNIKESIPNEWFPALRDMKGGWGSEDVPGWIQDYYANNVNGIKKKFNSPASFGKYIKEKYGDPFSDATKNKSEPSKGIFQQKELSDRGRYIGADLKTQEGQFLASMSLMIDNYHRAKSRYPYLTDAQLVDLSTLMHNAPGLAAIPEYVDYYIRNNKVDYVNKVLGSTPQTKKKQSGLYFKRQGGIFYK
jgi:hypothetical protein